MSEEETFFCDYCGYDSRDRNTCTHCGKDITDLEPRFFQLPAWGRLTIRLLEPATAGNIWKELTPHWQHWEKNSNLGLMPSQVEKFNTQAPVLELYGSDFEIRNLKELLQGRGSIEFEELPQEALPKRPRGPPTRPPYVPRRKR